MKELVFLKLGGSLITDKAHPNTLRRGALPRLAREILLARKQNPDLQIIIVHGSGSFGHHAARKYGTITGVTSPEKWRGFAEVWQAARTLNQKVVEAFSRANLPVLTFPGSAGVMADQRQIVSWDLNPLEAALAAGLIPIVAGDVIFDRHLGGPFCPPRTNSSIWPSSYTLTGSSLLALNPEFGLITQTAPELWI